jgi:ABC-type bacteriocin/lantibiotic exporters, contain an N-terminal double-glycine peptidase domain
MKLTGLNYFVENHPHGLDMLIGERGEALSNGQRQSIILTRTLLRDPPILLLDEPTSMMDSPTESHIQKTLKDIFTDRTLILVTHRATLLNSVDHLIVIDKGNVVAQGPRDEVLEAISSGKVPAAENRYE